MIEPHSVLLLLLLGGWAALDGTAAGQFMISRPLVVGVLAGMLLGDPLTGILTGAILELLHLGALPVGGARLPEPGPATVPAVAVAVVVGGAGGLALGLVWGVAGAWLGGASVSAHRRWNERRTRGIGSGSWTFPRVARVHWTALATDGLRGMALVGAGLALVLAVPEGWVGMASVERHRVVAAGVLGGCLSLGRLSRGYLGVQPRRGLLLLLAGLGTGVLLGLLGGGG
jgi:mannose/fructose/N-acetylgalactosamine-specific phosphotransferase system component IIC